ncbi:MAG: hypothetical protein ABI262_09350, partial [Microcoleus sp.]
MLEALHKLSRITFEIGERMYVSGKVDHNNDIKLASNSMLDQSGGVRQSNFDSKENSGIKRATIINY